MLYTNMNCAPGAKVYDDQGEEIRCVVRVDVGRAVVTTFDNVLKHGPRKWHEEREIAFERIEATNCNERGMPSKFICYGRKDLLIERACHGDKTGKEGAESGWV